MTQGLDSMPAFLFTMQQRIGHGASANGISLQTNFTWELAPRRARHFVFKWHTIRFYHEVIELLFVSIGIIVQGSLFPSVQLDLIIIPSARYFMPSDALLYWHRGGLTITDWWQTNKQLCSLNATEYTRVIHTHGIFWQDATLTRPRLNLTTELEIIST